MIPLRRGAFSALSVAASLLAFAAPSVQAQDAPAPVAAPDVQTRTFRPRNVKASLMAFWLDPARQPTPLEIQDGRAFNQTNEDFSPPRPRLPGNGNGPIDFKLPPGIEHIVAVDARNSILVTGTSDALDALEKLLPALDVPPIQYEVETHFYELDCATLSQTGLKFQSTVSEAFYNPGLAATLPADFEARMGKLLQRKKATLLSAPRITVLDDVGSQVKRNINVPVAFDRTGTFRPLKPGEKLKAGQQIAFLPIFLGARVKVTRMESDLLSISIEPRLGNRILAIQTSVRDGQPFAIQMSPSTDKRQTIIVVTPRRVRRLGGDA